MGRHHLLSVCFLLLALSTTLSGIAADSSRDLKLESVVDQRQQPREESLPWRDSMARLFGKWGILNAEKECEEQYGIMPCSTSLGGNAALLVAYGFMLLKAAQLLSDGSELLLTVMSPGIIGGLVLPILGAFPDALLITGESIGCDFFPVVVVWEL